MAAREPGIRASVVNGEEEGEQYGAGTGSGPDSAAGPPAGIPVTGPDGIPAPGTGARADGIPASPTAAPGEVVPVPHAKAPAAGIPPPGTEARTAGIPATSAEARAAVLAVLESCFGGPGNGRPQDVVVADVLLVTSELVTNAHRHGGGLTHFTAEVDGDALRLCVGDASPVRPVSPPAPAVPAEIPRIGGYGWQMVRRLAREVTVTTHSAGKTISAVLMLT